MKKIMYLCIVIGVIILMIPFSADADIVDQGTCGDNITWTLSSDGLLTISGSGLIEKQFAFNKRDDIIGVDVLDGITGIADYAFNGCGNLEKVVLPESLSSLGSRVFYNCSALKSIIIPDKVENIEEYAFAGCDAIRYANVESDAAKALCQAGYTFRVEDNPCNLKYLFTENGEASDLVVVDCSSDITDIVIPDGVTVIDRSAFNNHSKLKSIVIPNTVTCIGEYAFYNCDNLTGITIPESVTSLGAGALGKCASLTSIVFPDGIASIGEYALSGCNAIRHANIGSDAAKALSKAGYTFRISNSPCDLKYLYTDGGELSDLVIVSCDDDAEEVVIPNGVAVIDRSVFNNHSKLKNITIPDTVTRIGDYAFYQCISLNDITIPESVTSLGAGAFGKCSSLTSIVIPDGVAEIGEYALAETKAVRHARIGTDAAKALGRAGYSFRPANARYDLKYIYSDGQNSPDLLFLECDGDVQTITIPDEVTIIGESAFWQCKNLTEIVVPQQVKTIEKKAFLYCSNLKSLTILKNVTEIEGDLAPVTCVLTVNENSCAHQYALQYGLSCKVIEKEIQQKSGASTVEDKVREIVTNEVTDDMSQFRKAQVLHNWLLRNVEYDQSRAESSMSAASALLHEIAVCEGYSTAYGLLLDAVGIENDLATGENHAWNVAKIDGDWCHIDATFDDGWNTFGFFAVTDFALQDVENHENYSPKHQCNNFKITYAYRSGKLAQVVNSWMDEIYEHIRKGETAFDLSEKNDTMFGINDRMAVQMLRDTGITVDEKHYSTAVEYELKKMEKNNCSYVLHFSVTEGPNTDPTPSPEPTPEPTPTSSPEPTTEPMPGPTPTPSPKPTPEPEPADQVEAYVYRCYKIILGRTPDAGGLKTWYNELTSGRKTASEIIDRFVNSPEYINKHYNYGDSVDILYRAMLGRNADAGGKANWVKKLENGQTLAHVINGFCFSKEFRGLCDSYGIKAGFVNIENTDTTAEGKIKAFVQRCYRIILDREADPSGMQTWYEQLSSGKKAAAEIIDRFVNSPEFSGKRYSHSDSVEILYKAMLGRGSDAAGKANWVGKLGAGQPFAVVINGFCVSKEFTGICASYGIKPGNVNIQLSAQSEEELSMLALNAKEPITRRSETKPNRVEIINPSDTIDMNIGTAVQAVYINEEKAKEFISRCYWVILGREASEAEVENWIGQMVNGTKTPDQIARGFLFSNEFKGKNTGNEDLVKILYRVYMNRDADPEGLKTWTEKLDNGTSLKDLMDAFAKTGEFRTVVKELSQ